MNMANIEFETKNNMAKNYRTIVVEGRGDKHIYERVYGKSKCLCAGSWNNVIEIVKASNQKLGITPFVTGIIDRDTKTDCEVKELEENNVFALKTRNIEMIFLDENLLKKIFGIEFYFKFLREICIDASIRAEIEITDYNEAINILCKNLNSKYCIRLLMRMITKKQKGGAKNILFLCQRLDELDAWYLVNKFMPELGDITSKQYQIVNNSLKSSY